MMSNEPTDIAVYDDYELELKSDVTIEDHDGYCSDSTNERKTYTQRYDTFPLLKVFKTADIDKNGNVDLHNSKLRFYIADHQTHRGSWCGCMTSYDLKKARVVKKHKIVLDS